MKFFDVWENSFVPLLAGIPLLILILYTCCTCVDKTITALRLTWIYYKCKPRTPRRVRFDCESGANHHPLNGDLRQIIRSNTSPQLSGLMAHSSYLQRNPNYRYGSVVHSDRNAGPLQARTVLQDSLTQVEREPPFMHSFVGYNSHRRSSTPTPIIGGPTTSYYSQVVRSRSPLETYNGGGSSGGGSHTHKDSKQRRYSTPNSPSHYPQSPRREDSNYSSISYLPEVRAYLQFLEMDPEKARKRSHSFSGRNSSSRSSSRRSSRRSSGKTHHRPRSRSPSPYALERTHMPSDEGGMSSSPSSYGRYLTPQGSSDQSSFKSPEAGTPDWLDDHPPSYEDCLMDMDLPRELDMSRERLSRSNSGIRTSFI